MAVTDQYPSSTAGSVSRRPNWTWVAIGALTFAAIALLVTALRPAPKYPFVANESGMAQMPSPAEAPYLTSHHIGVTIVMGLVGLAGVGLGLRMSLKGKTLLPVLIALSTLMIAIPEVFYDVIGGVYFPFSESEAFGDAYSLFGRVMPLWILCGWFGYGINAVVTYWILTVRPATRTLWYTWILTAGSSIVFEEILLNLDVYHYYGNQPLVMLTRLPWWWAPCNSVGIMLAAALAYRFRDRLRGIGALAMLVITPMAVTGIYGFIALPSWIAVNADYPWLITQLLGLTTLVLGVFAFMGVLKLVLNRDPFALDYKPSEDAEFLEVQ